MACRSTLCRAGGDAAAGSSPEYAFSRRSQLAAQLACLTPLLMDPPSAARAESTAEATVTDRVFLDFGLCPEVSRGPRRGKWASSDWCMHQCIVGTHHLVHPVTRLPLQGVRSDRKLGDKSILCSDPEPLGRLSIALFGNDAPGTVAQFKALVTSGALQGSSISKILPGRWIMAGRQGPKRSGLLEAPPGLPSNPDTLSSAAFRLHHQRPGTLSLNLSENEDEDYLRQLPGYRNLSFFITLGPGQVALDDENIVFGQVVGEANTHCLKPDKECCCCSPLYLYRL